MLIVNADDWGYDAATTERIARVFEIGAITSVSAMVHMDDSRRAAQLALERRIPAGLHLNLMESFSEAGADQTVCARQEKVVRRFRGSFIRRWLPGGSLYREAWESTTEQIEEFERLYGALPDHVDGHQHGHLSLSGMRAASRHGTRTLRPSFTFRKGEKSVANRALRSLLNRCLTRRFTSCDRFFSIRNLHPALGGQGIEEEIARSSRVDLEIMVHPGLDDEFEVLTSQSWREMLENAPLGTYDELGRSHEHQ
jgi:predicted glycoside hydrolase/deacetylase ChbG (UPF0249 family)